MGSALLRDQRKPHIALHADDGPKAIRGMLEATTMFNRVLAGVREYLRDRAEDADLLALNDAALDDIGLMRGDIIALQQKSEPARERPLAVAWPFDVPAFAAPAHAV